MNKSIREKAATYGSLFGLEDTDLLRSLLYSVEHETASKLLERFGSPYRVVMAPTDALKDMGLSDANIFRLEAFREVLTRHWTARLQEKPVVNSPADFAVLIKYMLECSEQEMFVVGSLTVRNKIINTTVLYKGTQISNPIRVGEVFREAIRLNAHSIIVAHNHPSGDPTPSPDDVAITRALVHSGKSLDINVLDHIVVGNEKWVSMKERGLGF